MTAIGKIFVILCLLFSWVVTGFIVIFYVRSENWYAAQKKWEDAYHASEASRTAAEKELADERVAAATRVQEKDDKIKETKGRVTVPEFQAIVDAKPGDPKLKELESQLTAAERKAVALLRELEEYRKGTIGDHAELLALKEEVTKRTTEIAGLEKQIQDKDARIAETLTAKNDKIAKRISSEINATSFKNKAEGLERSVREMAMKLAKIESHGSGSGNGIGVTSVGNPAPHVDGVVVDKDGDLLKISVGSDSGLEKDHILDVYRLKPTPQYIGQIRLKDVRAKDAVGVFVEKPKGPVLKGDLVSNDVYSRN